MTEEEERNEAERLAEEIEGYHGCLTGDCPHDDERQCFRALILEGVLAGRESLRAETIKMENAATRHRDNAAERLVELKAERERSAKLISAIRPADWEESPGALEIKQAIAEYEASRD